MSPPAPIPGFRPVPFTGVIYVMAEAGKLGYRYGHPDWCNLGQGQPETGPLPGAPPRVHRIEIGVDDQDYAPIPGIWELRRAWMCSVFFAAAIMSAASNPWPETSASTMPISVGDTCMKS
jgi:hypothetical protein